MNEWKKRQAEKEQEEEGKNSLIDQMGIDAARLRDIEESANSSSLSHQKAEKPIEESYSSDAFEDVSMSGSGSKKLDVLSGRTKKERIEESLVSSNSNLASSHQKSAERKSQKSSSAIGESSNYDDDVFDSLSKSKDQLSSMMHKKGK